MRTPQQIAAALMRALEYSAGASLCILLPRHDYVQLKTLANVLDPDGRHGDTFNGVPVVKHDHLLRAFLLRLDHTGNPILEQIP